MKYLFYSLAIAAGVAAFLILNKKLNKMGQTLEQWQLLLASIDASTTKISENILALKDQIANQGLPADVEAAVFAQFDSIAAKLALIAADPENPNPNPEPTEE